MADIVHHASWHLREERRAEARYRAQRFQRVYALEKKGAQLREIERKSLEFDRLMADFEKRRGFLTSAPGMHKAMADAITRSAGFEPPAEPDPAPAIPSKPPKAPSGGSALDAKLAELEEGVTAIQARLREVVALAAASTEAMHRAGARGRP